MSIKLLIGSRWEKISDSLGQCVPIYSN